MQINRRDALFAALAATMTSSATAQTPPPATGGNLPPGLPQPSETINLWAAEAPGMPQPAPVETVVERSNDRLLSDRYVAGITQPRLVVFRPRVANGAAIMIAPGGGYRWVVIDKEGYELGRWFAARGYTVFVLFYRLPGDGWAAGPDVALSDAQRGMRLIRRRAADYGIDPGRVAAMGFSAGGHLCADLATRFDAPTYAAIDTADALSARPTLAAPIYPVISMSLPLAHAGSRERLLGLDPSPELEHAHSPHHNVTAAAPPHFLLHAEDDDSVVVDNTLLLRAALRDRGVPVESHLFTHGGHGFGLRKAIGKPVALWPELFLNWAQANGLG